MTVEVTERAADVSGDRCGEHHAEKLRGRRLPVRAGNADEPRLEQPIPELDLAPDRHAAPVGLGDERRLARHAGALDEHVYAVEQHELAVVPELPVGRNDLHPAPLERSRRRPTGPREPEDEHPLRTLAQRNPVK